MSAGATRIARASGALTRLPLACLACAAIAFVNAVAWASITPPFQVPDEIDHVTYAQYVAEWHDIPGNTPRLPHPHSAEVGTAVETVRWSIEARPAWTETHMREFERRAGDLDRHPGNPTGASINNPPLYYVLGAVPYKLSASSNFFDRLFFMRLLSALLAATTVSLIFGFVREVVPRPRWAATVGALAVAFQPMFGFVAGGVNNDNLLYACGAALIYLLARSLRRGLTPRLGVVIGAVAAAGMLTKTSFSGLLPGAALGVALAVWRASPERRRESLLGAGAAAVVLALPLGLWLTVGQAAFDRTAANTTAGITTTPTGLTLRGMLSYTWQVFLPALPGMESFHSLKTTYPLWDSYFQGFVGRFGWWRFGFPLWVNQLALAIFGGVLVLAGSALVRARRSLRLRWPELLTYVGMATGYVAVVEVAGYAYQAVHGSAFEQTRYLLPLLSFYALIVVFAARAGGRRWGLALGSFLVVLAMTHSLFAMLLVTGHYYA